MSLASKEKEEVTGTEAAAEEAKEIEASSVQRRQTHGGGDTRAKETNGAGRSRRDARTNEREAAGARRAGAGGASGRSGGRS